MGYTHYWSFNKPKGSKIKDLDKQYKRALRDCARIALFWNASQSLHGHNSARLSGYTAHSNIGQYGGLKLNGKGEQAHEDFSMREHFKDALKDNRGFCKTARKPYDAVIVACLIVLKARLGNAIELGTDGNAYDWQEGVRLAELALRRPFVNYIRNDEAKS